MSSNPQNQPTQPLIDAILASYRDHAPQLLGRRIWLACSGGRDSLSLAALCQQLYLSGQLPFLPQLLHVNHGLQAANSDWAQQVEAWASVHDMPCQVLSVKIEGGDEQAARQARYTAMMQVMNKGDVLLLGHHGDDQVETVLMRLLNGAGVHGLGGMRAWSQKHSPVGEQAHQSIYLWRPWLSISREQITVYAQTTGLEYIDDPTNVMASAPIATPSSQSNQDQQSLSLDQDQCNDRAWLRSVIVPQLQARFPQAGRAIMRSGQLLQEASSIVTAQAEQDIADCRYQDPARRQSLAQSQAIHLLQSIIDIDLLLALPSARQAAAIHQWLSPAVGDLPPPKRLVDEVRELYTRRDLDQQTCLNWYSQPTDRRSSERASPYHYEIRRYQHQLLRLRSDWAAWLAVPPLTQSWPLVATNRHSDSYSGSYSGSHSGSHSGSQSSTGCLLKPATLNPHWQLNHLSELAKALAADLGEANTAKAIVQLQPLARELKVTLAGRQGRKSGKKLLQALAVPAFMRESVVLCAIKIGAIKTGADETATNNRTSSSTSINININTPLNSEGQIPLFVITLNGVVVLESPYQSIVQTWLAHHSPVMQLRHNHNHS